MKISIKELEKDKFLIKTKLESKLNYESLMKAKTDYHAKRPPRPCGLTIHPGIGCDMGCTYCYIEDMGFDYTSVKPYGLRGEELAYSLIINDYFFPGLKGTYLAFGSVTEPFHQIVVNKTIEFLKAIDTWLKNPCQFSTKFYLTEELVEHLKGLSIPLCPLITIITLKYSRKLEPKAPDVEKRLESMRILRKHGFKPFLFFRPIIPGINDNEAEEIFKLSKEAGAYGVVLGGLRITIRILGRLKKLGFDLTEIKRRIPRKLIPKLRGTNQIPIIVDDIKIKLSKIAKELGLIPFKAACCANTYNIFLQKNVRIPCFGLCFITNYCVNCPVNCKDIKIEIDLDEVKEYIERKMQIKVKSIETKGFDIIAEVRRISTSKLKKHSKNLKLLESIYRRRIILLPS